ncbi:MAG TPA: hypothetical protein VNU27_13030 [Candidatus Acidoferrum sp.]|jgi:hypothetical protein|nr:hypothetical protein [Candidatus Acidoferrum sp.]
MAPSKVDLDDEWLECRVTVGRFDGYLADIRKYGFTLVTLLLTASALVTPANSAVDRPAAAIVILLLLLALFMIDMYYWVMLKAAVGRAAELEGSPDRITGVLSTQARASRSTDIVLVFYALFVLVTFFIPVVALVTSGVAAAGGIAVMVVAVALEGLAMAAVYFLVERPHGATSTRLKLAVQTAMMRRAPTTPKP